MHAARIGSWQADASECVQLNRKDSLGEMVRPLRYQIARHFQESQSHSGRQWSEDDTRGSKCGDSSDD